MTAPESDRVRVVEVGPRDGLQNEAAFLPTAEKVELVERLAEAGLPEVEATSFVRPDAIPNLADADEVSHSMRRRAGTRYTALVPNRRGLERALACGYDSVAYFMSASEAHNRANVNRTVEESLAAAGEVRRAAGEDGVRLRAYLSTSFGCPYEGPVDPERVAALAGRLAELGYDEISLGDTIGVAGPADVDAVLDRTLRRVPADRLALHLHDTRGTALANALEGYRLGIRVFDGSVGGLGGCPYAPGAAGNVASEDLAYMFATMGVATGVNLDALVETARWLAAQVGHDLPGHVGRAGTRWWPGAGGAR